MIRKAAARYEKSGNAKSEGECGISGPSFGREKDLLPRKPDNVKAHEVNPLFFFSFYHRGVA